MTCLGGSWKYTLTTWWSSPRRPKTIQQIWRRYLRESGSMILDLIQRSASPRSAEVSFSALWLHKGGLRPTPTNAKPSWVCEARRAWRKYNSWTTSWRHYLGFCQSWLKRRNCFSNCLKEQKPLNGMQHAKACSSRWKKTCQLCQY